MKSTQEDRAEQNAQQLREFSRISPNKRSLLRDIVNSAPSNISRDNRLDNYFAAENEQPQTTGLAKRPLFRAYAGIAVALVLVVGGSIVWFGRQSRTSDTQNQSSQVAANGKVANAINAITQQAQTELQTAQTATIDTANLDAVNTQLGQMQEAVNEKF